MSHRLHSEYVGQPRLHSVRVEFRLPGLTQKQSRHLQPTYNPSFWEAETGLLQVQLANNTCQSNMLWVYRETLSQYIR